MNTVDNDGLSPHWQRHDFANADVLCLGCGRRPFLEAINHDRTIHADYVNIGHDLDVMPWEPFCAEWVDVIIAQDLVEHLADPYGFVNECHRILIPGGLLVFRMSAFDNPASYNDLTHKHLVGPGAFDFFDPETPVGAHYRGFHPVDFLGRLPTDWHITAVHRTNADPRWPDRGDWQWSMIKC